MDKPNSVSELEFPAGRYYVGDPCYVCHQGISWQHGTAYGDGIFKGSNRKRFYVDSGQLSVIPESGLLENDFPKEGAHIVRINEAFRPRYEKGVFYIGSLSINTDPVKAVG